uniref:Uncharacterized protein n=1 Tax=Amanita bisporigera TaxID=87325 RepID=A0A5Q0N2G6_AMABI|nr:hypothetical protein [Amanita bisporigera]QFZ98558.1 hypothetical protein [Amanita bisporigera]
MKTIKDILQKYIGPRFLAAMTAYSWYQSRFGPQSSTLLKTERDKAIAYFNTAREELSNAVSTVQDYQYRDIILQDRTEIISKGDKISNKCVSSGVLPPL